MTAYPDILGHQRPVSLLEKARAHGRVAHAYLFSGPAGVGKEKVALSFAAALNCRNGERQPCWDCESCNRILRGSHPDVRLVCSEAERVRRGEAEPDKGKRASAQIRNEDLDSVADVFRHRPYMGRVKVVLIVDAEAMNGNSQNRFLKTLEEPSDDTVIILLTAHPESLLPTVRSRCQVLSFGPLGRGLISAHLKAHHGVDEARAQVLAAMSQGSLGLALQMADDEFLTRRDKVLESVQRVRDGDLADLLEVAGELTEGRSGRDNLQEVLDLMELWCRDMLLREIGGRNMDALLVNQDRLESLDGAVHPTTLMRWVEQIRRARSALRTNANPRLTMERCLLAMRASRS